MKQLPSYFSLSIWEILVLRLYVRCSVKIHFTETPKQSRHFLRIEIWNVLQRLLDYGLWSTAARTAHLRCIQCIYLFDFLNFKQTVEIFVTFCWSFLLFLGCPRFHPQHASPIVAPRSKDWEALEYVYLIKVQKATVFWELVSLSLTHKYREVFGTYSTF